MKIQACLNSRCLNHKAGLFLFEVVVAVAVVSVGTVFILRSFSKTLNTLKSTTRYYQALQLLENKAWDLEILNIKGEGLDAPSINQGGFKDNPDFLWSIDLQPVEGYNLNRLELSVSWPQARTQQSLSVVTYAQTTQTE